MMPLTYVVSAVLFTAQCPLQTPCKQMAVVLLYISGNVKGPRLTALIADINAIFPSDQTRGYYVVYLFLVQEVHILTSHFHQRS
jgi:hypothetical protein